MPEAFRLSVAGVEIDLPEGARRLIVLLALSPDGVERSHAAFTLWPDCSEDRARHNLRAALWRLRQARSGLAERDGPRLWLDPEVEVDVPSVLQLAQAILSGACAVPVRDACRLLGAGDLLDTWCDTWCDTWLVDAREHLRQTRLPALEVVALRELEAGQIPDGIVAQNTSHVVTEVLLTVCGEPDPWETATEFFDQVHVPGL